MASGEGRSASRSAGGHPWIDRVHACGSIAAYGYPEGAIYRFAKLLAQGRTVLTGPATPTLAPRTAITACRVRLGERGSGGTFRNATPDVIVGTQRSADVASSTSGAFSTG